MKKTVDPATVRYWVNKVAEEKQGSFHRGVLVNALDKIAGDRQNRLIVLWWLFPSRWRRFEQITSKDLSDEEIFGISEWIKPIYDKNAPKSQKLTVRRGAIEECELILRVMQAAATKGARVHVNRDDIPPMGPAPDDGNVEIQASKHYRETLGAEKYLMLCGHYNDSYDAAANPCCTKCAEKATSRRIVMDVVEK